MFADFFSGPIFYGSLERFDVLILDELLPLDVVMVEFGANEAPIWRGHRGNERTEAIC